MARSGGPCIGLLVPSVNRFLEQDFHRLAPAGVTICTTRMPRSTKLPPVESLREMIRQSVVAAQYLADCQPDVILFACTSASVLGGAGAEQEISGRITAATGVPCVTTSAAVVQALRAAGATAVAVFTPYVAEINRREQAFLEDYGFRVPVIEGLEIPSGFDFAAVPAVQIRAAGLRLGAHPAADTLFLSCTNIRSTEVQAALAADLGKPVITSTLASLQAVLALIR